MRGPLGSVDEERVWRAAVTMGQIGLGPYDLPEAARHAVMVIDELLPNAASSLTQYDPTTSTDHVPSPRRATSPRRSPTHCGHSTDG